MNEELNNEIELIKDRNKRVEKDKKWETSWTRRICIMILTYIVVVLYTFITSKINNVFLSSLVPVIGFTLSTLSLSVVREFWDKRN
jgi:polyferredoxin